MKDNKIFEFTTSEKNKEDEFCLRATAFDGGIFIAVTSMNSGSSIVLDLEAAGNLAKSLLAQLGEPVPGCVQEFTELEGKASSEGDPIAAICDLAYRTASKQYGDDEDFPIDPHDQITPSFEDLVASAFRSLMSVYLGAGSQISAGSLEPDG